jgi:quinol-cytochrome oxidoreductase complex cytochrome b subunit
VEQRAEIRQDRETPQMSISRLLFYAGPLLWAVMIVFHPNPGGGSPFEEIRNDVDRWLFVHIGQLILTPLVFLAVWRLLDGINSTSARISRAALVVWTVFFSAYDTVQGIATGILTSHADGLPAGDQAGYAQAIQFIVEDSILAGNYSFIGFVAGASWFVVAIAAAVALHKAGAGKAVVAAASLSIVVAAHVAPAAIGFLALFVAGVLREREKARSEPGAPAMTSRRGAPQGTSA